MQFAHLLAAILYGSNEIYFPSHQRDCNVGLNAEQGLSQLTFIYALLLEVYDYFLYRGKPHSSSKSMSSRMSRMREDNG